MSFDRQHFSAAIQYRLLERNISGREAAKEIGISPSTISRLMSGELLPDIESFALVMKWLDMDANMFLDYIPSEDEYNEAWIGLGLSLSQLHVSEELIKAIVTIVRLIRKEQ